MIFGAKFSMGNLLSKIDWSIRHRRSFQLLALAPFEQENEPINWPVKDEEVFFGKNEFLLKNKISVL
jgi:hypothetical protein